MKRRLTIVPAYGRDYTNQKAVLIDWNAGKDFIVKDMLSGQDGRYINKQDAETFGAEHIHIRYDGTRKIMVVKIKEEKLKKQ